MRLNAVILRHAGCLAIPIIEQLLGVLTNDVDQVKSEKQRGGPKGNGQAVAPIVGLCQGDN